jgi:NAD(P)-dependent dehydrogenase (short-subunit alcohol dehydrogenase family)
MVVTGWAACRGALDAMIILIGQRHARSNAGGQRVYGQKLSNPIGHNGHVDLARTRADAGPVSLVLPSDLGGRRAVVTGAARGIGEAIAKWLIMAGADVTVVDKDEQSLRRAFSAEPCRLLAGDLSQDHVHELAEELTGDGPVELLVNNVGVTLRQRFLEISPLELDEVLRTNLRGPWLFTKRLVEALITAQQRAPGEGRRRRGSVLFVSSLHDRFVAEDAHYGVSKAGVAMLVRVLAKQLAGHRIRVNAISPGWIRTAEDLTTSEQLEKYARLRPRIPMGQAGVPADIARVALFLLSDAWSGYVTGQNIAVDGGLSLHNWLDE